jgi:hypothetical protein
MKVRSEATVARLVEVRSFVDAPEVAQGSAVMFR